MHVIDSEIIIHSHAHGNSHQDTPSGGHTKEDLLFISNTSHFEFIVFSCDYLIVHQQIQSHKYNIIETFPNIVSIHLQNLSLRAPPIMA